METTAMPSDHDTMDDLFVTEHTFDYGLEEVLALTELLGLDAIPSVDLAPVEGYSSAEREAAMTGASRSLVARGVVVPVDEDDEEAWDVLGPHAAIFEVAASSDLTATLEIAGDGDDDDFTLVFYVDADVTVEHWPGMGTVHRFTLFETDELLERIVAMAGIEPQPELDEPAAEIAMEDLDAAFAALRDADIDRVEALLAAAPAFARALLEGDSRVTMRLLRREGERMVGEEHEWVEGAQHGLWLVDRADDGKTVTLSPTTAEHVVGLIVDALTSVGGEIVGTGDLGANGDEPAT